MRVVAADRDDIRLTTKEKRSAWGGGHVEVATDGSRLHLGDRCDKVPVVDAPCSVSYVLEVPRRTAVRARSPGPATCTPRTSRAPRTSGRGRAT